MRSAIGGRNWCRIGLVVSVSASHMVGHGFTSLWGHTKTIIKMVQTASLHGTQCVRVGILTVQPDCLKGWVIVVPTVSKLMSGVDCVSKPRIFIQCSCLIGPPRGYESALCRTRMLLPNAGRKVADWLLRGFIQCANIQVLLARSITASVHKSGGCGMTMARVVCVELSMGACT